VTLHLSTFSGCSLRYSDQLKHIENAQSNFTLDIDEHNWVRKPLEMAYPQRQWTFRQFGQNVATSTKLFFKPPLLCFGVYKCH